MQALMLRLDGFLARHRRLVIAVWLLAVLAALPLAAQQSERLTGGGFAVPGSDSDRVEIALGRDFDRATEATLGAVLVAEPGAGIAERRVALARLREGVERTADLDVAPAALRRAERMPDGAPAVVVPLRVGVGEDRASDVAVDLRDELGIGDGAAADPAGGSVTTHLVGQGALWAGLQQLSKDDLESAEIAGFPIVALILLAVFGSLAAAALPLALGAVSVILTGAVIWAVSRSMEMSVFTTNMASMVGIGVAVDYSLFVLARYREEVAAGRSEDEARARALSTSGIAVVFSGLTVVASLAGLLLIDSTAMRSMAIGAIIVVAISVLAAATLLPALIGALGRRASRRGRWLTARRRSSPSTFWEHWTALVMRRPVLSVAVAGLLLLALAVPALELRTADGALSQFPAGHETRVGFEAAAAQQGPGASTPIEVVAPARAAGAVRAELRSDPGIAAVAAPEPSRDGRTVLVAAIARADGESAAAASTVERLRAALPAAQVGGSTAGLVDFHELVSGSMWKIVLFVLVLSYIVLLLLLRSVLLPLKAVLMNLLSVGTAYGVIVAVFQWGWLDGPLGYDSPGYVDTITPALVLAVVFGLSMDYEVFLLSRIRERFQAGASTRAAVADGLAGSARTITSAAAIMVAVFAVFVGTGVPSIQQLGLGCAVAIALDATLVRLVLVPAAMALMGRWNWWLPRPLERLLPEGDVERLRAA